MIHRVGIIGAGTMGSGIAQVAATAGCEIVLCDLNQEVLDHSAAKLEQVLSRLVVKGRIESAEKERIQALISYSTSLGDLAGSDLVIEAIVESLEIKTKLFQQLEPLLGDDCIIATNTSSLSVAAIAASLQKPERCLGIHFFNPAPLMKLVEVIPAVQTTNHNSELVVQTIKDWGKVVALAKDTPGFIVNRVARPFYGEALRILEEGIADVPTIDWALKSKGGFRMGPFELMDFIGNDVNYTVTETVFEAFYYDPRYKPSFTQKRLSEAGYLGRKSGRGYYNYAEGAVNPDPQTDDALATKILNRVLVMLINEAADALYLNIASAEDIDLAMTKGVNYPKGLLAWADEFGIANCVDQLDALYDTYREDRYRTSPILRKMAEASENFF